MISPPSNADPHPARQVRSALDHLDPVTVVDQATIRIEVSVRAPTERAAVDYVTGVLHREALHDAARVERVELVPHR